MRFAYLKNNRDRHGEFVSCSVMVISNAQHIEHLKYTPRDGETPKDTIDRAGKMKVALNEMYEND